MKLSKHEFCTAVNTFREMLDQENKYCDMLNVNPEWGPGEWINNYYELLSALCDLEVDIYSGTVLDWFCFDTKFGTDKSMNKIYDTKNDRYWRIESPETLYDYIMEVELEEY